MNIITSIYVETKRKQIKLVSFFDICDYIDYCPIKTALTGEASNPFNLSGRAINV